MIRLSRTIYIGHELRLGRFVAEPHAYTGRIHFIWFRRGPHPNIVKSLPYRKPKDPPPMPEIITKYERLPVCDRNLDPTIAHGIAIMLDRYCEWLNAWLAAEPWATDHRYNPPTVPRPRPRQVLVRFLPHRRDVRLHLPSRRRPHDLRRR